MDKLTTTTPRMTENLVFGTLFAAKAVHGDKRGLEGPFEGLTSLSLSKAPWRVETQEIGTEIQQMPP